MKLNIEDDFGSLHKAPTVRPASSAPKGGDKPGRSVQRPATPIFNAGRPRLGETRRKYVNCTTGGDADQWARLTEIAYELRKTRADLIYDIFAEFLENHDAEKKRKK